MIALPICAAATIPLPMSSVACRLHERFAASEVGWRVNFMTGLLSVEQAQCRAREFHAGFRSAEFGFICNGAVGQQSDRVATEVDPDRGTCWDAISASASDAVRVHSISSCAPRVH